MIGIYTAEEIADILRGEGDTEMSARTVAFYASEGIIPERYITGKRHWYGEFHLCYIRAVRALSKMGVRLPDMSETLSEMTEEELINLTNRLQFYTPEFFLRSDIRQLSKDITIIFGTNVTDIEKSSITATLTEHLDKNK